MNAAEEDALVEQHAPNCFDNPNCDDVSESFRLAIRAAYAKGREEGIAHERERAARVCIALAESYREDLPIKDYDLVAEGCAAAIRRGE